MCWMFSNCPTSKIWIWADIWICLFYKTSLEEVKVMETRKVRREVWWAGRRDSVGDNRGFRPSSLPGLLAFSGHFWPLNKNSVLSEYYCVLKMQKLKHKVFVILPKGTQVNSWDWVGRQTAVVSCKVSTWALTLDLATPVPVHLATFWLPETSFYIVSGCHACRSIHWEL